jgi:hypothetical protein
MAAAKSVVVVAAIAVTGFVMWVWAAVGRIIGETSVIKPVKRGSLLDWIDMVYNIVDADRRARAKRRRNQRR